MMKRIVAPLVIGGALLTGATTVAGTAYAATPVATATSSGHTQTLKTWVKAHRRALRREGIAISAKTIGVTSKDLVAELRSGKSIADVAGEHNVSAQTVVNALVGAADTAINKAVAGHELSSAEAMKIEAALPGRIGKLVNRTF
jgi:hypothetical protein